MSDFGSKLFVRGVSTVLTLSALGLAGCAPTEQAEAPVATAEAPKTVMDERISHYAGVYKVPEELIRRSIRRESGYNPKARNGPYWGLMQIRYDTAKGMGYHGPVRGLLDADTNLKYACAYLANAYTVAGGDPDRAIRLYAGGYYYEARRKGLLAQLRSGEKAEAAPAATPVPALTTAPDPALAAMTTVDPAPTASVSKE
jgi:soluble lytic murein transglycosylase-like protein